MKAPPKTAPKSPAPLAATALENLFCVLAGSWLGLSLIKFGNPIILDKMVGVPSNFAEIIFQPWPVAWGFLIGFVVLLAALPHLKFFWNKSLWPVVCLILWFFWVALSNTQSIAPRLSNPALLHFAYCLGAFFVALFGFSRIKNQRWFWVPLLLAFGYVLFNAFDQRHGGLDAMRKAFYEQPNWQSYPPEFLLKLSTNRIFSTLVYPNALAGAILLLLPVLLWQLWQLTARWPRLLRAVITGLYGYLSVSALYWTGSKGGWLVALAMAGILVLQFNLPRRLKITLLVLAMALGMGTFAVRYSGYFRKGAPSVSARFIYWEAAYKTALANPILGTGPATFQIPFSKIKAPEAEMTRLVHNDYLEQGSDSGIPAFLLYLAFILGSLFILYRHRKDDWPYFLVFLGLFGWSLQSMIEFGLYIPALSWTTFFLFGFLWGVRAKRENSEFE